jgi:hypothetical protein
MSSMLTEELCHVGVEDWEVFRENRVLGAGWVGSHSWGGRWHSVKGEELRDLLEDQVRKC